MELDELKKKLEPQLNPVYGEKWTVYSAPEITDNLLIILDYGPTENLPSASFALSLESYSNNSFPRKCWITSSNLKAVDGVTPNGESGEQYGEVNYKDKLFFPYSVNLSEYKPHDVNSIKTLIKSLYKHIIF